jgi:ATP-dependent helicase Lhr and Lhr-like helicase
MAERRARKPKRGYGLPPEIDKLDHLGKQLARRRVQERNEQKAGTQDSCASSAKKARKSASNLRGAFADSHATADDWFAAQGWQAFEFQRTVWAAIGKGKSGLLHATTGSGKTYAVWLGVLQALRQNTVRAEPPFKPGVGSVEAPERLKPAAPRSALRQAQSSPPAQKEDERRQESAQSTLQALWITPMRALAADSQRALQTACDALGTGWTVEMRTGDSDSATKARQRERLPHALVTTPESLSLLLAREDAPQLFMQLKCVVVDEWHELMGNKRGTQTVLAIARLARWNPHLIVWGCSATLGNLNEARAALMGGYAPNAVMVQGAEPKTIVIDTLIPQEIERFPWGGHLGIKQTAAVIERIEQAGTTLVFTNVRSQAEIWYQSLLAAKPEWAGLIALHHGSLDKEIRDWVEQGLKAGTLKAVVCTSSLDLGVDFLPVEQVLQIGSPKGVARLLQRAGRSGHAPGRSSRITLVPTNALELVEAAAARRAALAKQVEPRQAPAKPLDVLVQHLVTCAMGGGFTADALFEELRSAHPYRDLTRVEFDWCLGFVEQGGALSAYPDYHRIVRDDAGAYRVERKDIAQRHRMSIGTIVSDSAMVVAWASGGKLGTIEESFIARLKPGDVFTFSGRILELVRVRDMTATVKVATRKTGIVPQWGGSRMPLSSQLADASLDMLALADQGDLLEPEMQAVAPLLALQRQWSALPKKGVLVCELLESREGHHFFCYPFAGRMVHIGLASLLGFRAARNDPGTFSISMNDYGFELLSAKPFDWPRLLEESVLDTKNLLADVLASLNASELAQRRFREIARVAGLIFQGFPGAHKSTKSLQASSSLFYEVFRKHDAGNLLLTQSENEVLEQELEITRLREALKRMHTWQRVITRPKRFTPFSFALMVERFREQVTTEKLADRVQRMLAELEAAASKT